MAKERADQATKDLRVRSVMQWILTGFMTRDIIAQCKVKWEIDERMAYKYIKEARKLCAEVRKEETEERLGFYLNAKLKLYNELREKDTPRGAMVADTILNSMAKIEGLMTDRVDVTSKGDKVWQPPPIVIEQVTGLPPIAKSEEEVLGA